VIAESGYRASMRGIPKGLVMNPKDKPAGTPGHCPDPADQPAPRDDKLVRERGKAQEERQRGKPDEAEKGPGSASADVGMTADGDN